MESTPKKASFSDDQKFCALRQVSDLIFDEYSIDVLQQWHDKRISTMEFMTHPLTVVRDMFDFSDPFDVADEINRQTERLLEFYNTMKRLDRPTDQTGE
jgi:hypothetical protein